MKLDMKMSTIVELKYSIAGIEGTIPEKVRKQENGQTEKVGFGIVCKKRVGAIVKLGYKERYGGRTTVERELYSRKGRDDVGERKG